MARADNPGLPGPNEAVDYDADFRTVGLGPTGDRIEYYDFGLSTGFTMPAYRLVDAEGVPIPGQLPLLELLPGQPGYSDFWQVTEVEVPLGYVANTITSVAELKEAAYPEQLTLEVLNCPVVSSDSVATEGEARQAWIDDEVVSAFSFEEAEVRVRGVLVDYIPIYVCMNEQGFCREDDGSTHNVIEADPSDPGYSPLWQPMMYPEDAFDAVRDLPSAMAANPETQTGLVNCPVIVW